MNSFGEMMFSANMIKYYAGSSDKVGGKTIPVGKLVVFHLSVVIFAKGVDMYFMVFDFSSTDGDYMCYTRHEPVGICGAVIPVRLHFYPQLFL